MYQSATYSENRRNEVCELLVGPFGPCSMLTFVQRLYL